MKGIRIQNLNNIGIFSLLLAPISLTKHWMLTKVSQESTNYKYSIQKKKKKENPGVVTGIMKMAHLEIVIFLSPQFLFMTLHTYLHFKAKRKYLGYTIGMVSWNGLVLSCLCQVASSHTGYSPMNTNSTVLHYQ